MRTTPIPPFYRSAPATAVAGILLTGFGVALSPLGPWVASAFAQGWLAVFLDAQAFRLFCG